MKSYKQLLNKGFTLIETVVVIGMTAILAAMVTPDVVKFLQFYEQKSEQETLFEIKNALKLYADDWGGLPADLVWYTDLLPYTDLSTNQIRYDFWFRERQYRMFSYNYTAGEGFRGQQISADYAMIISYGTDGLIDPNTVIVGEGSVLDLVPAQPNANLGVMPSSQFDALELYNNLSVAGDDKMVVFTNLPEIASNIQIATERINTFKASVEAYAISKKSSDIAPTEELYRPMSTVIAAGGADPVTNYNATMRNEVDTYLGAAIGTNSRFNTTTPDDNTRRASMISLARFLGLIDSACCNPLIRYDDDGDPTTPPIEAPFYYYSNPRPTLAAGPPNCGTRPVFAPSITWLSARVLSEQNEIPIIPDIDNCG